MRFAILLRGFHFMERDRHGFRQDFQQTLDSFRTAILAPLQQRGSVDVFIATYPAAPPAELEIAFQPVNMWIGDPKQNTQVDTYCHGLDLILSQNVNYDKIICTRFDLTYLKPVSEWNVWHAGAFVYLPWREHPHWWNRFRRTGDFVHMIDGPQLKGFRQALDYYGRSHTDMHTLYDSLKRFCGEPRFLSEGHYYSDPMYSGKDSKNPLYRVAHRPDLWTPNFNNSSSLLGGIGWAFDKIVARLTGQGLANWEIKWRLKQLQKKLPPMPSSKS